MKIQTGMSTKPNAQQAIDDILLQLQSELSGQPDFVALHFSLGWEPSEVQAAAKAAFATSALHGGSSCQGVMTDKGLAMHDGFGMGAFAIWDKDGAYGTAMADLTDDPRAVARQATEAALRRADRAGEAPDLVWLTTAPGAEELVLEGIKDVLGREVIIVGGSSADNDVSGKWSQFTNDGTAGNSVVVSVLFPSRPVSCDYQSGYAPTQTHGKVTRVEGRRLHEIDGKPAASVYTAWTGGAVPEADVDDLSILAASTFFPLGRYSETLADVPFHLLVHPAVAHPDGSLSLFADVEPGETLWMMNGSADSLVARAGRVAASSREDLASSRVGGALVIYCGGCMLSVHNRMEEVAQGVSQALGGAPFLGVFTFGEQGAPLGSETRHGNLMISCSSFG
jgi:hypothetical protein